MDKPPEGQWVLPNPQIPRSFGLMNIAFGTILLLCGAAQVALTIYAPVFMGWFENQARKQLEAQEARRASKIAELDEKVKAAKTEEEKADLQIELQALQSKPRVSPNLFDEAKKLQHDLRIVIYTYAEMSAGIVLNILMIVSGVGLVVMAEWSRRLAIATAWLKIARWVAIAAATAFVITPVTTRAMQPTLSNIQMQTVQAGGGATSFSMGLAQFSAVINVVAAVGIGLVASVYPVCVIWFLTRPQARAACLPATSPPRRRGGREPAGT